jgi:hypothetical protein
MHTIVVDVLDSRVFLERSASPLAIGQTDILPSRMLAEALLSKIASLWSSCYTGENGCKEEMMLFCFRCGLPSPRCHNQYTAKHVGVQLPRYISVRQTRVMQRKLDTRTCTANSASS